MRAASAAAAVSAAVLLAACTFGPSAGSPLPSLNPTASTTGAPSPSPSAPGLESCPAPQPESALAVLARPGGAPDDLAPTGDGGLWISDESNGRITRLDAHAAVTLRIIDPRGPEGIVPRPDGTLIVAEQIPDRVVLLRPPSAVPTSVLVQLQPVSGRAGIDSVEVDAAGGRLLIPDSARGALRAAPAQGGSVTTLASGLGRPVDAAVGPDGAVYVAAENAPGLTRVPASGGPAVAVGSLVNLDDVLPVGRLLYVTDMADGTVRAVDPSSGDDRTLVTGIAQPQGLARLDDGRLALSDSSRGLVAAFSPC
jgi:DNA-binding beta-propeller fold protein YncE